MLQDISDKDRAPFTVSDPKPSCGKFTVLKVASCIKDSNWWNWDSGLAGDNSSVGFENSVGSA